MLNFNFPVVTAFVSAENDEAHSMTERIATVHSHVS
jgi:hypothetical protein